MKNSARQLFDDLLKSLPIDETEFGYYILRNPVLLSAKELNAIYKDVKTNGDKVAKKLIIKMATSQNELAKADYPFGHGPFEKIYYKVKEGLISLDVGIEEAIDQELYLKISPIYVRAMCDIAEQSMRNTAGEWSKSINLLRLIIKTLEDGPRELRDREYEIMWACAIESWVAVVAGALHDVPDGRLFREAVEYGEDLLEKISKSIKPKDNWLILNRLGVLHLDPYFAGRSRSGYSEQQTIWQKRIFSYFDQTEIARFGELLQMPEPKEALDRAAYFLEKAVNAGVGTEKARSLKALAETYAWKKKPFNEDTGDKVVEYATQALQLFVPPGNYAQERVALLNLLEFESGNKAAETLPANEDDFSYLLSTKLDEIIDKHSEVYAFDLFSQAISYYVKRSPETAIKLWIKGKELVERSSSHHFRETHYKKAVAVIHLLIPEWEIVANESTSSLIQTAKILSEKGNWTEENLAAAHTIISFYSISKDEEEEGLQLLLPLIDKLPEYKNLYEFTDVLYWLQGSYLIGIAVNKLKSGDVNSSIIEYGKGLKIFLDLRIQNSIIDILNRIKDLVTKIDVHTLTRCIVELCSSLLKIELEGGILARSICQDIFRIAFMNVTSKNDNSLLLLLIIQYAKGFAFAATLDRDYRIRLQDEPEMKELLDRINILEKEAALQTQDEKGYFDEDALLTSYIGNIKSRGGRNAQEMLGNLQIKFDELLYTRLIAEGSCPEEYLGMVQHIQSNLDADTILLINYFGSVIDGRGAIFSFFITNETLQLHTGILDGFPSGYIEMDDGETTISRSPLNFMIAETRKEIKADVYRRVITPEGKQRLIEDSKQYLGGEIKERLEEFLIKGKKHLCIIPHGGLHFYPYHLLPVGNGILADKFIVTYKPNMRFLDPSLNKSRLIDEVTNTVQIGGMSIQFAEDDEILEKFKAHADRRSGITCMGLSFSTKTYHPFLDSLPNVVKEVTVIAAIYNTKPLIDGDVTEYAFWEAMHSSKMVHISSHGKHNVIAPVFQCIYVYPEEHTNGIIHAYEVFGVDLRGLELVTLSACETALGRVDHADNLRGLPAALLTAGVETIIGTLWETKEDVCALFFKIFYEHIKNGEKKYHSFYLAQQSTKDNFPEYRDWGAFYLMGKHQ